MLYENGKQFWRKAASIRALEWRYSGPPGMLGTQATGLAMCGRPKVMAWQMGMPRDTLERDRV